MANKGTTGTNTNPVYKVPAYLMEGVEGKEFLVNNYDDEEEAARVIEEATKEVLRRTGGAGFPILCTDYGGSMISAAKRGVERAGATALIYHEELEEESCSEVEVEEWLRRRRSGKEERVLIADHYVTRGWECSHVLVVHLNGAALELLVMRAVGYCALVKGKENSDSNSDSDDE